MWLKRVALCIGLSFLCFAFFTPKASSSVSTIYGPEIISTETINETPVIALDAEENAHIIWIAESDSLNLVYKMVDREGNVIIAETNLTPFTDPQCSHAKRPAMVIDSSGELHIVFHSFSHYTDLGDTEYAAETDLEESEVIYIKLNPNNYLTNIYLGQTNINDLIIIPETIISTNDHVKSRAPNIALNNSDRLHITWFEGNGGEGGTNMTVHYRVMDLNGGEIAPETCLTTTYNIDTGWGEPQVAVDSMGNAHIIFCTDNSNGTDAREIYYTMVSVAENGAVTTLIDETIITTPDDHASVRAQLAIDSQNMVHVIWHDKRLEDADTGSTEIFYSKLNPSLDDQDGDAADRTIISVISEARVSSNNDLGSNQKNIAIDRCDRLHITWSEDDWGDDAALMYTILNTADNIITVVEPEMVIAEDLTEIYPCASYSSSSRNPVIAISETNRVFRAFNGYHNDTGNYSLYLSILCTPCNFQVEFSLTKTSIEENMDTIKFTIELSEPTCQDVIIPIFVEGTARAGSDFFLHLAHPYGYPLELLPAGVFISAGSSSGEITVMPIDDNTVESDETIILTMDADNITNMDADNIINAAPGTNTVFIITIKDDDRKISGSTIFMPFFRPMDSSFPLYPVSSYAPPGLLFSLDYSTGYTPPLLEPYFTLQFLWYINMWDYLSQPWAIYY